VRLSSTQLPRLAGHSLCYTGNKCLVPHSSRTLA
jgi:hypothetical protein